MNGRVTPVMGRMPVTAPMFTKACAPTRKVIPMASWRPRGSGARRAAFTPARTKTVKRTSTSMVPRKPASSPMMEKMKSLWALGRYMNFWRLMPSPRP